ncbi:MAG: hypothetical protein WD076_02890 [Parvularculaceae bacterium]
MSDVEEKKRRKQRSLAIALAIAAFVAIVYLVTILKIGGSIAERAF